MIWLKKKKNKKQKKNTKKQNKNKQTNKQKQKNGESYDQSPDAHDYYGRSGVEPLGINSE